MPTIAPLVQLILRLASAVASSSNDGIGSRLWMRIYVPWEVPRNRLFPISQTSLAGIQHIGDRLIDAAVTMRQ